MNNKKILIIVLLAIICAFVTVFCVYKKNNLTNDTNIPDIEEVQESKNNESEMSVSTEAVDEKSQQENKSIENKPPIVTIKKVVKTTSAPKPKIKKITVMPENNVETKTLEEVVEENSLLKDVPRSDVVVVDKEYKMKSPSKYFFK